MPERERFNPNQHLIQLKNRQGATDYLPVNWRLVWLHDEEPDEVIIEKVDRIIDMDREITKEIFEWNNDTRRSEKVLKTRKGWACYTMRASAVFVNGRKVSAEMDGSECAVDFEDFIEKAQTKALGRALGAIGFGTQFAGDEFDEQHRIVDAPVDRGASNAHADNNRAQSNNKPATAKSTQPAARSAITPPESRREQEGGIKKMCGDLKMEMPDLSKVADGDVVKKWTDLYPIWKQWKQSQNQQNKSA